MCRHAGIMCVVLILLLVTQTRGGYAGEAMPYTAEAVTRLHDAFDRIKVPPEAPDAPDQNVRNYIAAHRKIFAAAGFDYEQSMIAIITHIKNRTYMVNKASITLNRLARQLLELHGRNGVSPRKYLGKDCAEMVIEFRDVIRKNMAEFGGC